MGGWSFKTGELESDTRVAKFLSLDPAERFLPNNAMNVVWYKFSGDKADAKPPKPRVRMDYILLPVTCLYIFNWYDY